MTFPHFVSRRVDRGAMVAPAAVLLSTVLSLHAQPPAVSPRITLVQQLVWAAYPDLQTLPLQTLIRETASGVTLELAAAPTAARARTLVRRAVELRVEATFDASDRLTRLTASGLRAHDPARATLLMRGAGEGEVRARARRAGLRVAPDDPSAAQHLRVEALTPVLGALTVTRTHVETRDPATRLRWRVEATAADGTAYELVFEPVEGRLVGLTRMGGVE